MSYFAQGFNPFQGQASQQYPYHQTAQPAPPGGAIFPGLQSPFPPAGYEQAQNAIPGLAFGTPLKSSAWQPVPPQASTSQPKLVPAAQYYQPDTARPGQAVQDVSRSIDGTAEEGEVSEGAYDDLYEPAEATVIHNADGADDYDPADPGWYDAPALQPASAPRGSSDLNNAARERSGSYSPYLSPREFQQTPLPAQQSAAQPSQGLATTSNRATDVQMPEDSISDKKQKASAAVRELWSLDVRFRNYVDEGIDPSVIKSLFGDLGLDASDAAVSTPQIPGILPTASSEPISKAAADAKASSQPKSQQAATTSLSPESLADKKAEERKDRIARLYAAKATKTEAAASTTKSDPTEKELKLQQKMEALQKAREARAQKAASKKDKTTAATAETAALEAAASTSKAGSPNSAVTTGPVESGPTQHPTALPVSQNGAIPGLPISTSTPPAPFASARKRPVASDFVDVPTGPSKRPFGQERRGKLVIDVSEGSDDEDIEMDMGSGDESVQAASGPLMQRTTSFRDVPPLAEMNLQRQFSSPVSKKVVTPPNGNAANMDQEIERMRRRIALAEARQKLKKAMNKKEVATPKSDAPTPDASSETIAPKPPLRRVQSMDPPMVSESPAIPLTGRSSPVVQSPESSRLPKRSDVPRHLRENRQERFRTLSQSLPQLDGRLQAKTKKLRLLQSQISRLEREIEHESTEKQQMEDELAALEASITSEEPEIRDSPALDQTMTEGVDTPASQQPEVLPSPPAPVTVQETDITTQAPSEPTADDGFADTPVVVVESAAPSGASESRESQAEVSEPPTGDVIDEQPDSSKAPSEDRESSEGEVQEVESDEVQVVDTETDIDDSTEEQQVDNAEAVPLPQASQQPTPDPLTVPNQISLGANDSVPDEGLGSTREVYPVGTSETSTGLTTQQLRPSGVNAAKSPDGKVGFKPYQSPLEFFRDFRYHSSYASQVPGGLRSLTYSNQIDPNLPLCPDQLDGRQCPKGADCEYQHFESMKLPDDQILLQLGATKLEGADRARFNSGLRELLQSMREQNVKDFPRIAQGIVDYHNRFTGDPTKVLSLGDVTL